MAFELPDNSGERVPVHRRGEIHLLAGEIRGGCSIVNRGKTREEQSFALQEKIQNTVGSVYVLCRVLGRELRAVVVLQAGLNIAGDSGERGSRFTRFRIAAE